MVSLLPSVSEVHMMFETLPSTRRILTDRKGHVDELVVFQAVPRQQLHAAAANWQQPTVFRNCSSCCQVYYKLVKFSFCRNLFEWISILPIHKKGRKQHSSLEGTIAISIKSTEIAWKSGWTKYHVLDLLPSSSPKSIHTATQIVYPARGIAFDKSISTWATVSRLLPSRASQEGEVGGTPNGPRPNLWLL